MNLYPVIMAGGSGTRFWPLSRQARPKQFLPLVSNKPLIAETAARLGKLAPPKRIRVVCGAGHASTVRKVLKQLPKGNVLIEPAARNTAPAIGLAALHVGAVDPQGVLAVLPSDQHVSNVSGFRAALAEAASVAEGGSIVTLGITPSRPETGYGYIRAGDPLVEGARRVKAFVEKPDQVTAQGYLASGEYLWNAGIFVFRADVMLAALQQHAPELWPGLAKIQKALGTSKYAAVLGREFPKLQSISIDYAVAERADNIAVIPGDFGWSDVGSFNALPEVREADAKGNVVAGAQTFMIDSQGCVVLGEKRAVAVVGMTDVVVVDSGDALLVIPKDKCQDVRKVVEVLKAKKLKKLL